MMDVSWVFSHYDLIVNRLDNHRHRERLRLFNHNLFDRFDHDFTNTLFLNNSLGLRQLSLSQLRQNDPSFLSFSQMHLLLRDYFFFDSNGDAHLLRHLRLDKDGDFLLNLDEDGDFDD